jgi:hypothetical protein
LEEQKCLVLHQYEIAEISTWARRCCVGGAGLDQEIEARGSAKPCGRVVFCFLFCRSVGPVLFAS